MFVSTNTECIYWYPETNFSTIIPLTRRGFLSTTAAIPLASFSGCLSGVRTGENGETEPSTYDVRESPDEVPETIDYAASVTGGGLRYSGSPLTLTVELTNETNEEIAFVERRSALFHGVRNETDDLVLIPDVDSNEDGYEFSDGCWTETMAGGGVVGNGEQQVGYLDPGETVPQPLLLLARLDASCPESPLEEVSFATTVAIRRDADAPVDADSWEEHEWEFTLSEA